MLSLRDKIKHHTHNILFSSASSTKGQSTHIRTTYQPHIRHTNSITFLHHTGHVGSVSWTRACIISTQQQRVLKHIDSQAKRVHIHSLPKGWCWFLTVLNAILWCYIHRQQWETKNKLSILYLYLIIQLIALQKRHVK